MTVKVVLAPALGERIGGRSAVEVEATTVSEALRHLTGRYPELETLVWKGEEGFNPFLAVFLNDRDIRDLDGLQTPLRDGDEVSVVAALEGGHCGRSCWSRT
jgi:molybdopterin converting factor small subunit